MPNALSGITIDLKSGLIDGTPSQEGTFDITVTVSDTDNRTAMDSFSMLVYSKALAEKFSPILVLTEHSSRKGPKVICPEPVEIMGATSVDSLWFAFVGSDGISIPILDSSYPALISYPDPSLHTWVTNYYQNNYSVNFSKNQFAFIPEYSKPEPDDNLVLASVSDIYTHFDYPGKREDNNQGASNNWYNYYFSNTHPKRGNNPMFPNTAYVHVFEGV